MNEKIIENYKHALYFTCEEQTLFRSSMLDHLKLAINEYDGPSFKKKRYTLLLLSNFNCGNLKKEYENKNLLLKSPEEVFGQVRNIFEMVLFKESETMLNRIFELALSVGRPAISIGSYHKERSFSYNFTEKAANLRTIKSDSKISMVNNNHSFIINSNVLSI